MVNEFSAKLNLANIVANVLGTPLTFSPLDPSQRRVFRPLPRTTPFAATGYVVPKRTLPNGSIIVHTNYSLKSLNILHDISLSGSKN